eukprot:18800-Heterococcus_DN1.PRE.3
MEDICDEGKEGVSNKRGEVLQRDDSSKSGAASRLIEARFIYNFGEIVSQHLSCALWAEQQLYSGLRLLLTISRLKQAKTLLAAVTAPQNPSSL